MKESSILSEESLELQHLSQLDPESQEKDLLIEKDDILISKTKSELVQDNKRFYHQVLSFCGCFVGLQISYLTWGVMQELIMSTHFTPTPKVPSGRFPSATFCVFSNRFLAIIVAAIVCQRMHGTLTGPASLLDFTPCALSNTISSWSQYAALRYISFPIQNIFKSIKVLPVMLMGIFLTGKSYMIIEYLEAAVITSGVCIFSIPKADHHHHHHKDIDADTEFEKYYGIALLCLYVLSDCFTSQWQSRLFKSNTKIDQFMMMLGVNSSSIIITALTLILSGDIPVVIEFLAYNPKALIYNIITAITSASGQLFIFLTIKKFGAVVFTVVMTTRQLFSMFISVVLFGHEISLLSYFGAILVFATIFHSVHRQYLEGKQPPKG